MVEQRLPQLIGKGRAMEMIMTAGMVTAEDAYRTGLVNHVYPSRTFRLLQWLHKVMKNSPLAISKAIKSINANYKTVKMV
jgi:enoyl-CoA hydratase